MIPVVAHIEPLHARIEPMRVHVESTAVRFARVRPKVLRVDADVLFAFDSARLRPTARRAIASLHLTMPVVVTGHTDSRGTAAYNERLSLERARAVARVLTVPATAAGAGETRPIAPNATAAGRRDNRRVGIRRRR